MPGKREELLDTRPPRKMIRQIEELDNITKNSAAPPPAQGVRGEQDPYAIASAPDNQSPNRNGGLEASAWTGMDPARATTIAQAARVPIMLVSGTR